MEPSTSFKDLKVWQKSTDLTVIIYKISESFPKSEIFGLTSQIRRACVSIGSNLAEGFGRKGYREKDQFYSIAYGSLLEVENQLIIANRVGYLTKDNFDSLDLSVTEVRKMLSSLLKVNKQKGPRI